MFLVGQEPQGFEMLKLKTLEDPKNMVPWPPLNYIQKACIVEGLYRLKVSGHIIQNQILGR